MKANHNIGTKYVKVGAAAKELSYENNESKSQPGVSGGSRVGSC